MEISDLLMVSPVSSTISHAWEALSKYLLNEWIENPIRKAPLSSFCLHYEAYTIKDGAVWLSQVCLTLESKKYLV